MCVWLVAAALGVAPLASGQEYKETQEQLKQAQEAAKKMGVAMPDIQKLMDENEKEDKAKAAEEEEAAKKARADKPAGPIALPDWTPKLSQFTPAGPAAKKIVDGKEQIVVTGTSLLTPAALAAEWEKFKNPKFSREGNSSNINGSITEIVGYSNTENPVDAVRMEAERKAGAKVTTVTITSPGR
jgi:hypothetical protein